MRINELRLTNFRCFDKKDIRFTPGFNLFIGDNATGKTAVLEALRIGAGAIFLGLEGGSAKGVHLKDVRKRSFGHGGEITYESQYPVTVMCTGTLAGKEFTWHRNRHSDKGTTDRKGASELAGHCRELTNGIRNGKEIILPVIAYYSTGRLWQQGPKDQDELPPGSRLLGYGDCLSAPYKAQITWQWWKRQELVSLQEKADTPQLKAIRKAVLTTMPNAEQVYFSFKHQELVILFRDGELCPFSLLSDGYRNALAMVADIAIRAAILNPFPGENAVIKTPGIVLIDELDLHLHPKWQRRIVKDLRRAFPEIQFVATTHAEQILVGAQADEIAILKIDDSPKKIVVQRLDIPPGLRAEQVLTGEWFGLQSTLDPDTLELLEQHRELLQKPDLSDAEKQERAKIEDTLRQRLGRFADTPLERMALGIIAELTSRHRPLTPENRKKIRDEVLAKIRKKAMEKNDPI
ncbi:MAG: AAA family ATPase [Gammaproteobacteria bacterium]|nr:AAA family ATPase [Gammaproteobacteria bacterium]